MVTYSVAQKIDLQQCFVIISITTRNFDANIFTKYAEYAGYGYIFNYFAVLVDASRACRFCSHFLIIRLPLFRKT